MRSKTEPSVEINPAGNAGANLFQSSFWAAQKERFGWRAKWSGAPTPSLLLYRRLPGPFSLAYVPYGAAVSHGGATHLPPPEKFRLSDYIAELRDATEGWPEQPSFLRWDIPFPQQTVAAEELEAEGLVKARADVQPPDTVILDLRRNEEELLSGMKSKTRYNVRLAAKKGVRVELGEWKRDLKAWQELYRATAERDRIAIHDPAYYRSLFELAEEFDPRELSVSLYLAYHDAELLAGIIVARFRESAYYLYGASSNEKRNLMPAYALQWRAIRDSGSSGARSYDFFGIPPAKDPNHPMHGLYRFKVGFGGAIVRRPGAWDVPLRPLEYHAFRVGEGMRNYYYKVIKKRVG